MQRSWIIAVSVAFVVGSAGASYAAIAPHGPASPATALAQAPVSTTADSATYRIGDAGVVTVTTTEGALTLGPATAADGWTLVGSSAPGTQVEAQFSDGSVIVTFTASLVDGKIVVSVSSEATVTSDSSPASSVPMEVTQMSDPPAGSAPVTSRVITRPGTTQPWVPTTNRPTTVHTTSPATYPHTTVPHTVPATTHTTTPTTHTTHTTPTTPATHTTEPPQPTEPSDD